MKRLYSLLFVCVVAVGLQAQEKPLFIFEKFVNAKIHFKNRSVTVAAMNYDAVNDKMFFMQNEDMMELTNYAMIDSIVWAGKRTFISNGNGFLEQIKMNNGTAFIRWRIKNVNVGSRGAFGTVTQGKVESISIRSMGVFSAGDAESNSADVFQQKNSNEYFLPLNGKLNKVTNLKHLYKLYPAHKDDIKQYVDSEHIKMEEPLQVLQLLISHRKSPLTKTDVSM